MFRRNFFQSIVATLGAGLLGIATLVPGLANLFGTAVSKSEKAADWIPIGPLEDFNLTQPVEHQITVKVTDGWQERMQQYTVILVAGDPDPKVLSPICPHLACSVQFDSSEGQFVCPCHQTFFDPQGNLLSGPSPRDLDPLPSKVEEGVLYCQWVLYESGIPDRVKLA